MSGLVPIRFEVDGWGVVRLMRALPRREESWGTLACLRGTPWEKTISVVSGEDLSHALHGHPWPLLRSLGPAPDAVARSLPQEALCALLRNKSCPHRNPVKCRPGVEIPTCYQVGSMDAEDALVAYEVAIALSEGNYIIVTEGKTFSL